MILWAVGAVGTSPEEHWCWCSGIDKADGVALACDYLVGLRASGGLTDGFARTLTVMMVVRV